MAEQEHLDQLLNKSVDNWNSWRLNNPHVIPDLSSGNFEKMNLRGANLGKAKLDKAKLNHCDVRGTNFTGASLRNSNLEEIKAGTPFDRLIGFFFSLLFLGFISGLLWFVASNQIVLLSEELGRFGGHKSFSILFWTINLFIYALLFLIMAELGETFFIFISVIYPVSLIIIIQFFTKLSDNDNVFERIAVVSILTIIGLILFILASAVSFPWACTTSGFITLVFVVRELSGSNFATRDMQVCSVITLITISLFNVYVANKIFIFDEYEQIYPFLRKIALGFSSDGSTTFLGADLSNAVFSNSTLEKVDLQYASIIGTLWLGVNGLERSRLKGTILADPLVRHLLISGQVIKGVKYARKSFHGANLKNANLTNADFTEADLSKAILTDACLQGATLTRIRALGTDFSGADLTGACLKDWSIDSFTQLDGAICKYIFLEENERERRPSNGEFVTGDLAKLVQKAINTVDLIFRNGVDWEALLVSLDKLRVEAKGVDISVQGIEKKADGAFVIRVNVPPEAEKAEVEKFLKQEYELASRMLEQKYHDELQAKDREIEIYRQKGADLMELARLMARRPINVEARATAESQAMAERNINTGGGSYYETISTSGGDYIQGNYVNMSQDLGQAAVQIQDLLEQLQKQGVTVDVAKEQVARDMATQAQGNPTMRDKLVKWSQSLGEATVSDVVKGAVKLAIRSAGLPLP